MSGCSYCRLWLSYQGTPDKLALGWNTWFWGFCVESPSASWPCVACQGFQTGSVSPDGISDEVIGASSTVATVQEEESDETQPTKRIRYVG